MNDTSDRPMMGPEWYAKFNQEFQPVDTHCAEFYIGSGSAEGCDPIEHARRSGRFEMRMEADDAARRAAGIDS